MHGPSGLPPRSHAECAVHFDWRGSGGICLEWICVSILCNVYINDLSNLATLLLQGKPLGRCTTSLVRTDGDLEYGN